MKVTGTGNGSTGLPALIAPKDVICEQPSNRLSAHFQSCRFHLSQQAIKNVFRYYSNV